MRFPVCLPLVGVLAVLFTFTSASTHPPTFRLQNKNRQMIYEEGNALQLLCAADANPPASYRWEVNGKPFLAAGTDNNVVELPDVGTLLFNEPGSQYAGFYKCFASNAFGTAVGDTVQMITANLDNFPDIIPPRQVKNAGDPLRLVCNRPKSFPEATILWEKQTSGGSINIDYNDRVTIDPDGGLNFAYVEPSDTGNYRCQAFNSILRKSVQSKRHNVIVTGSLGDSRREPSKVNWIARTTETFTRGKKASIKCILAGKPIPGIRWRRTDNKEFSVRTKIRSYGLELVFDPIEYEDAANYECDGFNSAKPTPVKTTVIVAVQGHVEWKQKPTPVTKGENETVTFVCEAHKSLPPAGAPRWFINGQRVTENSGNRFIGDQYGPSTTFTVTNLKKERDTMAIQCNITNLIAGSWIHTSFYLNVQSERPTIAQFDDKPHKWAAGLTKMLTCKVFGAPTPIISWKKDGQSLTGGRFVRHQDGTLEVKNIGITDAGNYECSAYNTHGSVTRSTTVLVRRNTQIRQAPEDLTVTAGTQAKFVCTGITDPDEAGNLEIQWLKDGRPLSYYKNNRVYRNLQDNSLQIAGPISLDSGSYTCRATNGIDFDEATATLRVQDRPDRPSVVSIEECQASEAKIKWSPGTNNNAPLTNFIIQYQTKLDESIWYTDTDTFPTKDTQYIVQLTANNKYRFRVLAQNKIGVSDPSAPTATDCTTSPARPTVNPRGVRTLDEGENKLVVTWQPISPVHFGGTSFTYVTKYKKVGEATCEANNEYCEKSQSAKEGTLGRPGELNIIEYKTVVEGPEVGTYTKYEIAVISNNIEGPSTAETQFITGYSGEGNPKQVVRNFGVKVVQETGEPLIFSDNATLIWDAVTEAADQTLGFFRGYMIQYRKLVEDDSEEHFDTRSIYIILRDVTKEGQGLSKTRLVKNEYGAVEEDGKVYVTITHLPPNSMLSFKIAVINKRHFGTLSEKLDFDTIEGVPGPVQQLRIGENGPTHVRLTWQRPLEPNGVLTKYLVGYKTLNGLQLGPMQFPEQQFVWEPSDRSQEDISAKVTGLKPLQMFRFYVWAYTAAGQGSEYFIDDSTVAAGYPNPPTMNVVRGANNTLNVSWTPAKTGVPANVFYVQYKQESAIDQWQRTGWETNKNYIIVDDFEGGWQYEIRVIASNGGIYETGSTSERIYPTATSREAAEATAVFTSSWFVGLLIVLILVCTFFALLCTIQQNNGGIHVGPFAVEETERLKPYEENVFDEKPNNGELEPTPSERYAPSHFSERYPQSQHSEKYQPSPRSERYVGSQPPPQDEYMLDDPNRYGEEASFIGQYRENKELPNFRPRVSEPYKPPTPVQPQPRVRAPPSESVYTTGPTPEPRGDYASRGGYAPRGGVTQPRQAPARQPRNTATESSDDYRPQYGARTADYSPDTRYRSVPTPLGGDQDTNDTVV